MLRIHRPKRMTKRSGYELTPGNTTEVRGLTITNTNKFSVYVDKFTAKRKVRK